MKKESKISVALTNSQGFSVLELLVVIGIMSVLAAMAVINAWDSRKKANDTLALSDAKNIIAVVSDNFFDREDVKYDTGGWVTQIGTKRIDDSARSPVYSLSSGVVANATGFSSPVALGNIDIYFYHLSGTGLSFALYPGINVRTFYVSINEATGNVDTSFVH